MANKVLDSSISLWYYKSKVRYAYQETITEQLQEEITMKTNRLLALIIVFSMLLSFSTVIYASNLDHSMGRGEEIFISEGNNGLYIETAPGKSGSIRIAPYKELDTIYYNSNDNEYYQKINEKDYIPVSKVEFPVSDYNSYNNIQEYSIPNEILDDIATMAAWAEQTKSDDAKCVIFISHQGIKSQTLNTIPMYTSYWDGLIFHTYQVYFTDMWTTWQTVAEKSSTTQAVLNAIKDLTVQVVSQTPGNLGTAATIYSYGKTCLNAWRDATGKTPIYGNTNNKVMVDICYNIYLKYTYFYDAMLDLDRLGCSSQKVLVKQVDTDTYLYSTTGGARNEETVYPYEVYKTPNYDNPEETAYYHYIAAWVERTQGKVYNKTINFSFPYFNWPSDWP